MPNTYAGSVIIPTYNRSSLLEQTLLSLTRQSTVQEAFEVIVVDDGSHDNSREVTDSFRETLNIRYFWQEDKGFRAAAARNVGIYHANAAICIFLDSGVLASPQFVAEHLKSHMVSDSEIAVIGYVHSIGSTHVSMARDERVAFPPVAQEALSKEDGRELFFKACKDDLAAFVSPWLLFWTCNVSVRKIDLNEVGGFDETFRTWGGEDIELGFRLHQAGLRFLLNRQAAAEHLPHPISTDQRLSHMINLRYLVRKHGLSITEAMRGIQGCRSETSGEIR